MGQAEGLTLFIHNIQDQPENVKNAVMAMWKSGKEWGWSYERIFATANAVGQSLIEMPQARVNSETKLIMRVWIQDGIQLWRALPKELKQNFIDYINSL